MSASEEQVRIGEELVRASAGNDPFAAAVRATRMPMLITDPRQADNPIVFVNDAFTRLTGYARGEILGRNCRFLQGPATEPEKVVKIRDAIARRVPIEIELQNHKKGGASFWNKVLIAPVFDRDGELAYFFASQYDVTHEHEHLHELNRVLRRNERMLDALIRSSSEVRFRVNADWDSLHQLSGGNFIADTATDNRGWLDAYIPPEDRPAVRAEIARAIRTKTPYDLEHRVFLVDGSIGWAASRAVPLFDDKGEVVEWYGAASDITERRRAEGAQRDLAASLERQVEVRTREFDRAWRLSQELLVIARPDGTVDAVNPSWTAVLGWAERDIVGRKFVDFTHPDDLAATLDAFAGIIETPLVVPYEYRLRHEDGTYRWVSWTGAFEDGHIYAAGRDVTVERRRESELRDAEEFTRLALSSVGGVGVWNYDLRKDRFVADAAIADLYGLEAGRLAAGVPSSEFLRNVHPDDRETLKGVMTEALIREGDVAHEYRIRRPDGTTRWVLSRGRTFLDASGIAVRRTGVGIETTDQRRLEEQLRQSQKMEAVGQLTGGVAHDFNNLLTVIKSSTDLLKRPTLTEERRVRYVGAISDTVDRATRLTGQLLAFARRQALQPEVFAACDGVRALTEMMGTLTGGRIKLVTDLPDTRAFIRADPSQFDTALINMAVNARDAMDGEGQLTIRVHALDGMPALRAHPPVAGAFVAISLADTGSGIPADRLEQVFEPFFTTKDVGKGTGLGLSQVFGFAKQSGGEVGVASVVGRGTTFTLYLPQAVDAPPRSAEDNLPEVSTSGRRLAVLVVEDNAEVGRSSRQILEDLGHITDLATDAEEALAKLGADGNGFDVIFSDVVMPGMGGVALAEELRRRLPSVPVVLTSGYSDVLARDDHHGFVLLHKPYSAEQLARVLHRAYARTNGTEA